MQKDGPPVAPGSPSTAPILFIDFEDNASNPVQ